MKKYCVLLVLILSGCGSAPFKHNPSEVDESSLARVTTLAEGGVFNSKYNAWIEYIWNEEEEELTGRNPWFDGKYSEVFLEEGTYKFQVTCTNGRSEASPEAVFEIKGSANYQIYCEVEKGKNILGLPVDVAATIKIRESL